MVFRHPDHLGVDYEAKVERQQDLREGVERERLVDHPSGAHGGAEVSTARWPGLIDRIRRLFGQSRPR